MKETVTGWVSVEEVNEFLDRVEKTVDGSKDEWIKGAVKATATALRKLVGLARKEDVEPVIRCGECKYRNTYCYAMRPDNWYCADGEKRDE